MPIKPLPADGHAATSRPIQRRIVARTGKVRKADFLPLCRRISVIVCGCPVIESRSLPILPGNDAREGTCLEVRTAEQGRRCAYSNAVQPQLSSKDRPSCPRRRPLYGIPNRGYHTEGWTIRSKLLGWPKSVRFAAEQRKQCWALIKLVFSIGRGG